MSEPFLGEISIVGFTFPPKGWATCDGQTLSIAQNQALFSLLGTTYGGDGKTTFALPDFRGRVPMHRGQSPGLSPRSLGEKGGAETVTLTQQHLPLHDHVPGCSSAPGTAKAAPGNVWAVEGSGGYDIYAQTANTEMASDAVQPVGGQPHENMQPFLCLTFVIALQGVYPSRN